MMAMNEERDEVGAWQVFLNNKEYLERSIQPPIEGYPLI